VTAAPRPAAPPVSTASRAPATTTLADRIVAWVAEHPRSTPGSIEKSVGGNRKSLYEALAQAREDGRLVKEGSRPRVWYSTPGSAPPAAAPEATEAAEAAAPPAAPPSPPEAPASRVFDRVVAFVLAHPEGCAPRDMAELGASRTALFRALSEASTRGLVRKTGEAPLVTYFPPGAAPPAKAPARPAATSDLRGESLVEAVVAFVAAHPACRFKELEAATGASKGRLSLAIQEARTAGSIRLEGVKIKSRYFPASAPEEAAPPPTPRVATEAPAARAEAPPAPARAEEEEATSLRGETLLSELDDAIAAGTPDVRLGPLLQAIVAEVRQLQARVPEGSALSHRFDGAIRRITAIRGERNLPFIVGLKRGMTADWEKLALDARRRVAKLDVDAAEAAAPPSSRSQRSPLRAELEPFPRLSALASEKSIVLVGGIKKNEVLDQVRRNHGLALEWAAMQGANARAADHVVGRIRHGNVGAVVVLEGLTGTTQVKSVVEACKEAGVPYSYGGRAGTESLRSALREIEAASA
jgi:hypothetical protein